MRRTLKYRVRGKVQGVSYRASTARKASELSVQGYAKNLADGSVELCLQGESGNIEKLIDWCKQGPTYAEVESVEFVAEENLPLCDGFFVK